MYILQNITFYVQQKEESNTGMEQGKHELMMTEHLFLSELSL